MVRGNRIIYSEECLTPDKSGIVRDYRKIRGVPRTEIVVQILLSEIVRGD